MEEVEVKEQEKQPKHLKRGLKQNLKKTHQLEIIHTENNKEVL